MRLINREHLELLRCLPRASGHAISPIGDGRVHQHDSSEIFRAVTLDVGGDVLNALRPSDENRWAHTESLEQGMQILSARFRRVTSGSLGRFALGTRIDRDDPVSFGKSVDLPPPNIRARAPARNKDECRTGAGSACFNYAQRNT